MNSGPRIWAIGGVASVVLHFGAAAGLMAALQPQPVLDQSNPESRLNVQAQEVARSQAAEQAPKSAQAAQGETNAAKLDGGVIAQSDAKPVNAPVIKSQVQQPQSIALNAQPVAAAALLPSADKTTAVKPTSPQTDLSAPRIPKITAAPAQPAPAITAAQSKPVLIASLSQTPDSIPTAPQAPDVTASKAVLAFPASGPVDPVSLAAFQSFTRTDITAGTDVRDSLSSALAVPCSRMQVTFDPDTTTLKLTGHVPDAGQRGPVLAALQAQMGADIVVTDNLLILPAPQCAALSGIATVGLPQSTDQITNPKVVGADTHARAFRYTAGEPLVMELSAPDYPAYVYVDYFDADGNVIHLAPNDATPLQEVAAKSALQIGARSADEAGLFVTIGPPYGQEIAAAFAASVPLYDGNRPLVEPADAYLDWLKTRVAEARAQHADFKGEWVYFFVTTAAN